MNQPQPNIGKEVIRSFTGIFAEHFNPSSSWQPWITALRAMFALPLSADELLLFQASTGRTQPFAAPLTEAWFLCGRRSGKSRVLALLAVSFACFREYGSYLAPGEQPLVMVLAVDRDQAQVIFGYARALIIGTPMLASMIARETSDTLELTNGVSIVIKTSSYKSVRGRTLAAAFADEVAFWSSDDSRNPAEAILRALRPALSTIPGAPLILASSTYSQDGALYDAFAKHHGKDASSVMVWRAPTGVMNPSFSQDVIDAAFEADAATASAEYGSEWLTDVRQFLPDELIDAAIIPDRKSLVRASNIEYIAFVDVSGGVSDAMVLAIAHFESGIVVLDRMEAIDAPFKPEDATQRFADKCSSYGISTVTGDRYSAQWSVSTFRRFGLEYRASDLSASEIYLSAQPLFSQRVIELLDDRKLAGELRRLERRPRPGGKDSVTHPRGSHDDRANAVCGALVLAAKQTWSNRSMSEFVRPGRHLHLYDPFAEHGEVPPDRYGIDRP